jgi:phage repressor protein C with HTH and peptisase S24 domain
MPENKSVKADKSGRLHQIRKELKLSQVKFGELLGIAQSNVTAYENGTRGIGKLLDHKLIYELNVNPDWWESGEGPIFNAPQLEKSAKLLDTDANSYEVLTYISTKARASFMELLDVTVEFEAYRVFKDNPDDNYADQVVIEIGGDSMEPNYWDGCKVRCKEVRAGDWVYLNSGVYAVAYGNFFVVKRVKNSPSDGILTLHSDNIQTGGSIEVPLSKVRKIWRVLRIVDAPAR